jgi:hypothetical protein
MLDSLGNRFLPGVLDNAGAPSVITRSADAGGIQFGRAVFSVEDRSVSQIRQPDRKFLGVSMTNMAPPLDWAAWPPFAMYAPYDNVDVLTSGTICVVSATTAKANDQVYITSSAAFSAVAAGNTAINARYLHDGGQGDIVRIVLG